MPGQRKAGHIGHGMHPWQICQQGPGRVELGGQRDHARVARSVQRVFL